MTDHIPPVAFPLGIIARRDGDTITFDACRPPQQDPDLQPDTPIIIVNHLPDQDAMACCTGVVTELTENGASLMITGSDIADNWPEHIEPFGAGNPVYLAAGNAIQSYESYVPSMKRLAQNRWEWQFLLDMAADHEAASGIATAGAVVALTPPPENDRLPE